MPALPEGQSGSVGESAGVVPTQEVELLNDLVTDAETLAAVGRVVDGYKFLEFGLGWAEAAQQQGSLWAEELIRRYRLALARYAAAYDQRSRRRDQEEGHGAARARPR